LKSRLRNAERNDEDIETKVSAAITATGLKLKGEKTEYLLFLGEQELSRLAAEIDKRWNEIGDSSAQAARLRQSISEDLASDLNERQLAYLFCLLKVDGDVGKVKQENVVAAENSLDEILSLLRKYKSEIPELLDKKIPKRKKEEIPAWEVDLADLLKAEKGGASILGKYLLKILDGGKAVDLALFGRMLANMPEKNQNAACQVAHALSTHAVEREFDFYTAVDDLKPEDTAGADMMGTVEFNSACFYRYAVVDWEKLGENLQGDTELAAKGLRAFLEGFVVAEPTGKQNTFAAHNPPEFILVTVRRNTAPRNLANAFETAIRARDSLTRSSANALLGKARVLQAAYGGESSAFVLDLTGAEIGDAAAPAASLAALIDAVMAEVRRG
jgi:CRISPR system Cascade subunit CasC